jgi:hypothetical protein
VLTRRLLPATKRCPRCGASNPRLEPDALARGFLTCSHVVSEVPFEECDFTAPSDVLGIPFVRIGASGLPCFGQSTWNFVTHGRLWGSGSPIGSPFSRLDWWKGNEEASRQYESQLNGYGSMATHEHVNAYWSLASSPGLFGRRRNFILSVEDWAGEWISQGRFLGDDSCRLVDCNAFVLFVNPTRSFEELTGHAMAAFEAFFNRLRVRREAMKRPSDVPVAIAVPMLDLVLQNVPQEISSRAERLIREIKNSGPMNEATSLIAMKRRHQIVMELSRGVIPLPRLLALCESVVGPGRVLVFPMATMGWSESPHETLGAMGPDAAHQYLLKNSFGILDPLLWILHQLGLRRLPSR